MPPCRIVPLLLPCCLLLAPLAGAQVLTDDFSATPAGSFGAPRWEPTGLGWQAADGAMVATKAGGLLLSKEAGYGTALSVEATLTCPRS